MQRVLIPIVLCFAAQLASAQCVNATTAAPASPAAAAHVRPAVELIKTAAADTRDPPGLAQSVSATRGKEREGDERRPTGGAMLLAAVALMSGIALRRASASGQ